MNYRLSRQAEEDLIDIYLFSARVFGEAQADRYLDGLEQALTFVARHPRTARERTEIDPPVRIHVYQSHLIVYVIAADGVDVVRVRHGREDWATRS